MYNSNNKKFIILLILAITPICYSSIKTNNRTIPTMSNPVTNRVIIVDAGHGQPDGGAISKNGVSEEAINLAISFKLQKLLEQSGAKVIMTRTSENGIYDRDKKSIKTMKISDLKNRANIINNSNADIVVSIHLNKINESQCSGWQTFYRNKDATSKLLASSIQDNLTAEMNKENKRKPLKIDNIYTVKHTKIPYAIVECGFLSNAEEEKKLQQEDYQDKLSWGIYNGIIEYFNTL